MENIKKTKIEFLEIELKTIMSEMKNSAAGIRHRRFEEENVSPRIFLGQNWLIVYLLKT